MLKNYVNNRKKTNVVSDFEGDNNNENVNRMQHDSNRKMNVSGSIKQLNINGRTAKAIGQNKYCFNIKNIYKSNLLRIDCNKTAHWQTFK